MLCSSFVQNKYICFHLMCIAIITRILVAYNSYITAKFIYWKRNRKFIYTSTFACVFNIAVYIFVCTILISLWSFNVQDAYAEPGQDTRNIAGLEVVVIVQDVQDVPPIFTAAPPVTRLPPGLLPGDKVSTKYCVCFSLLMKFIYILRK